MRPKAEILARSISETVANSEKLLEDAKLLFGFDRFSTALALAVLAQEEFAKAFLLQLVADEALPWLKQIRKSMKEHKCKHLLALVMEWLPAFDWTQIEELNKRHHRKMEWLERSLDRYKQGNLLPDPDDSEPVDPKIVFPPEVAAAWNIYRHENIERLSRSGNPWKDEDWATGKARKIADGSLDRKKQSALYVEITLAGDVDFQSHPGRITREEASEAIERANGLSKVSTFSDEYRRLRETLPFVFSDVKDDEACNRSDTKKGNAPNVRSS
jgi:AbiV family abortive infection protein